MAHDWNLDPIEFWSRPRLSRAFMIAFSESLGTMQLFEIKRN